MLIAQQQMLMHALMPCQGSVYKLDKPDRGWALQVQYSQRNLAANKMRKYLETYTLNAAKSLETTSSWPIELRDTTVFSPSPSGALLSS